MFIFPRLMMLNKSSSLLHFFAKPFTRRFLAGAVVKTKTGMTVPRLLWLREKLGIKKETEQGTIVWVRSLLPYLVFFNFSLGLP